LSRSARNSFSQRLRSSFNTGLRRSNSMVQLVWSFPLGWHKQPPGAAGGSSSQQGSQQNHHRQRFQGEMVGGPGQPYSAAHKSLHCYGGQEHSLS
jgi:hypothetical protein